MSTRRVTVAGLVVAGLVVAAALAFFVSPSASSKPDGLNKVAMDKGFAATAQPHALERGPAAGYAVKGVDDHRLSRGLAGLLGVTVVFVAGMGLFALLRRLRPPTEADADVPVH